LIKPHSHENNPDLKSREWSQNVSKIRSTSMPQGELMIEPEISKEKERIKKEKHHIKQKRKNRISGLEKNVRTRHSMGSLLDKDEEKQQWSANNHEFMQALRHLDANIKHVCTNAGLPWENFQHYQFIPNLLNLMQHLKELQDEYESKWKKT